MRRDLETDLRQNAYLVNQITAKYAYGEDVSEVFAPRGAFDELTPTAIQDAARRYLNKNRYVQVTLSPERK